MPSRKFVDMGAPNPRMPAAFLGHGSPMNALATNRFTHRVARVRRRRPAAESDLGRLGALVRRLHGRHGDGSAAHHPRFFRFPPAAVRRRNPASGDERLAEEVADIAKPTPVGFDRDSWGLDHGAWSVLVHAFPEADIPVVQLAINARRPFDWHFELGTRLAPLRGRDVLVIGSGNVVHNLRAIDWAQSDAGFDWARRFDDEARRILTESPADIASLQSHADFKRAVPTPDHFIPLIYVAALAAAEKCGTKVLADGYAYGSLSMTCYGLDSECRRRPIHARRLPCRIQVWCRPRAPIPEPMRRVALGRDAAHFARTADPPRRRARQGPEQDLLRVSHRQHRTATRDRVTRSSGRQRRSLRFYVKGRRTTNCPSRV